MIVEFQCERNRGGNVIAFSLKFKVRVPKSMYLDWMKMDAQVADLKAAHDKKMGSLKRRLDRARARLEKNY